MPDLLTLPLRAGELVLRTVLWTVDQVRGHVLGDDAPPPAATSPAAPTEPPPRPKPKPRPRAKAQPRAAAKPTGKAARRGEPTKGEVAARRERQRMAEQNAGGPGPGPEIEVEPPWPGYDGMTEDEVLERLIGAEPALRAVVRLYEATHGGRRQILIATEEIRVEP